MFSIFLALIRPLYNIYVGVIFKLKLNKMSKKNYVLADEKESKIVRLPKSSFWTKYPAMHWRKSVIRKTFSVK